MGAFDRIVEQRILEGQRKGAFDRLEGAGQPLQLESGVLVPEELRLAYKILKNADCLPPEVELKKEILQVEDLLASLGETREKYQAMKKLNHLVLKLNLLRNSPVSMDFPEHYERRLVERFGKRSRQTDG
ncbi:MAG: DnaJ family domain-containing protein [Pseudomonadota bacterium]